MSPLGTAGHAVIVPKDQKGGKSPLSPVPPISSECLRSPPAIPSWHIMIEAPLIEVSAWVVGVQLPPQAAQQGASASTRPAELPRGPPRAPLILGQGLGEPRPGTGSWAQPSSAHHPGKQ